MTYDQPSLDVLAKVAPALRKKVLAAMDYLATQGVFFRVAQGLRNAQEQDDLYAKGRTVAGKRVTNARAGFSNHNFGCAVDCYPFIAGDSGKLELQDPTTPVFKAMIVALTAQGLVWGGSWHSIPDAPHFQLANVPVTPTDADRKLLADGGLQAVWQHYAAL